jgi:S1-C subfamily serine protease
MTLDLALVALALFVLWSGWHRGFVVNIFSLFGLVIGGFAALSLVPLVEGLADASATRYLLVFLVISICLTGGQSLGAYVGRQIRAVYRRNPLREVDNFFGSITYLVTWSIIVWILSGIAMTLPNQTVSSQLSHSKIVAALDERMPDLIREGAGRARVYFSSSDLPQGLVAQLLAPEVAEPDDAITQDPEIQAALKSVVRVSGVATACEAKFTGSGFVVAPNLIMTNAHVVAGISAPTVQIKGKGTYYDAKVVYFDGNRDVAILRVADIPAEPLTIADVQERGTDGAIAGFPLGGKLKVVPAKIRGVSDAAGMNIYGTEHTVRSIYSVRALVQQGDSGAPLLSTDGEVMGLVFAAAVDDDQTGYVLTPSEFADAITQSIDATKSVATGSCVLD